MEKRALIRNRTLISVACSSLTTNSPADVFNGTMLNCSLAGTCIELNQKMHKGSIVMIRATSLTTKESPPERLEGFRSLAVAEVKWSKPQEAEGAFNYAIGLRYLPN